METRNANMNQIAEIKRYAEANGLPLEIAAAAWISQNAAAWRKNHN